MSVLRFALSIVLALLSVILAAAPASAQRYDDRSRGRNVAGDFDYYALVLSWSPTHCATLTSNRYEPQCHRKDGRRYNFVLHGLWPQYERGFPGDCDIGRRPFVPNAVIDDVIDVMPSKPLIIHEYRKHGTCSGLAPSKYYELSERLFRTIKIPQRYVNPYEVQSVSPETLISEFLSENPQLRRDMIVVSCGGSRGRLKDVRICMTPEGKPRRCGNNENQRRLCRSPKMYVPPVRSSASARTDGAGQGERQDRAPKARRGPNPLPGPDMDRYQHSL